jgi:hypothetical protein
VRLEFSRQIFGKRSNIKFYQNPSFGSRVGPSECEACCVRSRAFDKNTRLEREGNVCQESRFKIPLSKPRHAAHSNASRNLVSRVKSERETETERQRERKNYRGSGHAGSLLHYPLQVDVLLLANLRRIFVLRKVFSTVVLRGCVIASRRFEGSYCLHLQCYESVNLSGRNYETTRRNHPKDLVPERSLGGKPNSLFSCC